MSFRKLCLAIFVLAFAALAARAADIAYLSLMGTKHGEIKGGVSLRGNEGAIGVLSFTQTSSSQVNSSGLPLGYLSSGPLIIVKALDQSSPVLREIIATNELIAEGTIRFYGINQASAFTNTYTAKFKNAHILSITTSTVADPVTQGNRIQETVTLSFETCTWTWNEGGITAIEDAKPRN